MIPKSLLIDRGWTQSQWADECFFRPHTRSEWRYQLIRPNVEILGVKIDKINISVIDAHDPGDKPHVHNIFNGDINTPEEFDMLMKMLRIE